MKTHLEIEALMDTQADVLTGEQASALKRYLGTLLKAVTVGVVLATLFLLFFRPSMVRGMSMAPTLEDGDCTLVQVAGYGPLESGDVVVIQSGNSPGKHLVKRIIAQGGDTVQIDFDQGAVYVNGRRLTEPYVNTPTNRSYDLGFPVTVPEGCYFVLGDNRNASLDSRSSTLGFVPRGDILGRVRVRFLPFGRIGGVE